MRGRKASRLVRVRARVRIRVRVRVGVGVRVRVRVVCGVERHRAAEQHVRHHAHTPHVDLVRVGVRG